MGGKKRKVGRPRKTLKEILPPNWKEVILNLSSQGCSDVEIRAKLSMPNGKFCHDLWYAIEKREEEFSATIKIGKRLCQAWWEAQGREGLKKPVFQTGLWFANMKNRFGWRDKQDVAHKGQITEKVLDLANMTDRQLKEHLKEDA